MQTSKVCLFTTIGAPHRGICMRLLNVLCGAIDEHCGCNHGTSVNHSWFVTAYAKFVAPELLGVDMPTTYMGVNLFLYLRHHWSFFTAEGLLTKELQELCVDLEHKYSKKVAMFPDLAPEGIAGTL